MLKLSVLCSSADMLHVLWEDASEPPDSRSEGGRGVRVSDLVDVVPSALSARLQTRTALTLSMSLVTNDDGCFDFLALSQEDWNCWYVGLRFLAETSEPLLQPLQPRENSPQQGAPASVRDGNHTTFYVDSSDFGEDEHTNDYSSRASDQDDSVPVAGLHELVPLVQELRQRVLHIQTQQSELAVCHQEALMMLAQAQAAQLQQQPQGHEREQDGDKEYSKSPDKMADSNARSNQHLPSRESALSRRIEELEQVNELKESTIAILHQLLVTAVCDLAT
jgi:hypothetical protein